MVNLRPHDIGVAKSLVGPLLGGAHADHAITRHLGPPAAQVVTVLLAGDRASSMPLASAEAYARRQSVDRAARPTPADNPGRLELRESPDHLGCGKLLLP